MNGEEWHCVLRSSGDAGVEEEGSWWRREVKMCESAAEMVEKSAGDVKEERSWLSSVVKMLM